jgi:predicted MFS family arabinose efflux permease
MKKNYGLYFLYLTYIGLAILILGAITDWVNIPETVRNNYLGADIYNMIEAYKMLILFLAILGLFFTILFVKENRKVFCLANLFVSMVAIVPLLRSYISNDAQANMVHLNRMEAGYYVSIIGLTLFFVANLLVYIYHMRSSREF